MKNRTGYILLYTLLCLLILPAISSHAQDTTGNRTIRDSLARRNAMAVTRDTIMVDRTVLDTLPVNYKALHSPRKAAFYSAVLPGLGQIYNREYWKVPLVYAALGVSTGVFIFNMDKFKEYRNAYRTRIANRNNPDFVDPYLKYDDSDLKYLRDGYRQYVDYSVLVFIAAYALNIVDATVFAHLRQFDISDDLSIRISPTLLNNRTPGIGLRVTMGPKKVKPGLAFR